MRDLPKANEPLRPVVRDHAGLPGIGIHTPPIPAGRFDGTGTDYTTQEFEPSEKGQR
jgi:hypothetical protein